MSSRAPRTRSPQRALLLALLLSACAEQPSPEAPTIEVRDDSAPPAEALLYMPLEDGTVFAYDTVNDSGEHGLLVMQVSRLRKDRIDLRVGSRVERLQIESGGISFVQGGFLLKAPFEKGSAWRSRSGTVRVVDVDVPAQVPAGSFQGCLRTVEESREANGPVKTVTSVYCPHVGLVHLDVVGETGNGRGHEAAALRSFGPRVDLTKERDKTTTTIVSD